MVTGTRTWLIFLFAAIKKCTQIEDCMSRIHVYQTTKLEKNLQNKLYTRSISNIYQTLCPVLFWYVIFTIDRKAFSIDSRHPFYFLEGDRVSGFKPMHLVLQAGHHPRLPLESVISMVSRWQKACSNPLIQSLHLLLRTPYNPDWSIWNVYMWHELSQS